MRVLAVDVGTGTQDVLLLDTDREVENAVQLVLPSPTAIVGERIRVATRAGQRVVLRGATMGGGPSAWAARDHARAGLEVLATPDAARTLDDDLAAVGALGLRVVSDDEALAAARRPRTIGIELRDAWLPEIERAVACFDVDLRGIDALALAVFDHGAAPPGVSDRRFRFERLTERLDARPDGGLVVFAYPGEAIPAAFTRLAAASRTAREWLGDDRPLVVMDTAPAAVLGALDDGRVRVALDAGRPLVVTNVGNFHTLAFRLSLVSAEGSGVVAVRQADDRHAVGPGATPRTGHTAGPGTIPSAGNAAGADSITRAGHTDGGHAAGADNITRAGRAAGTSPDRVRIDGLFEHHTGELERSTLIGFLRSLQAGTIENRDVFDTMGHGALVRRHPEATPAGRPFLAVTGPRRDLLGTDAISGLGRPHLAVPHGAMMQAGGFGLLRGLAHLEPSLREPIERRLGPPAGGAG